MAKNAKNTSAATSTVSAEDLNKFANEAVRQQQSASEYASSCGGFMKNRIESLKLHPKAVKQAIKMKGMEEGQRQSLLRELLRYSFLLGFFDQIDAFDDTGKLLAEICDRVNGGGATDKSRTTEPDPAVTQFN